MRASEWTPERRSSLLRSQAWGAGLPAAVLDELALLLAPASLKAGDWVFREGEDQDAFHLLAEGTVKIVADDGEGHEVILRIVQPGDVFGCLCGKACERFLTSARTVSDAIVLSAPMPTMLRLAQSIAPLASGLMRDLGHRLREAEERVCDLQTRDGCRRLATVLLRLASRGPEIRLTRLDLAELAGVNLTTCSRMLASWRRSGLLDSGRGWLRLKDERRLSALAGESRLRERKDGS